PSATTSSPANREEVPSPPARGQLPSPSESAGDWTRSGATNDPTCASKTAGAKGYPCRKGEHDMRTEKRPDPATKNAGGAPRLRAFAHRVETAAAAARLVGETDVRTIDVKYWLKHMAPSKPGEAGWSDPARDGDQAGAGASLDHLSKEELASEMERLEREL